MKDFGQFYSRMEYRFPNDVKAIIEAIEAEGSPVSKEVIAASYFISIYVLKQYHEWMNETDD